MSKNFSSYLAIVILAIVIFVLIFDDTPKIEIQNNVQIKTNSTKVQLKKENSHEDVEIVFIGDNDAKKEKELDKGSTNQVSTKQEVQDYQKHKSEENKIYELIGTGVDVAGFYINIASHNPIPARNPSSFPRIPAMISGKIDGKYFSMVVPSDLKVKDLKVKIQNQKTQEIKYITLGAEHLKAGASNVLNIDSNNFENIELRSDASSAPPLPPLPTIPGGF